MKKVPINTSTDLSLGLGSHNFWLPPIVPAPIPAPAIEMVATMKWPPGFLLNLNKLTTTVKHRKRSVVQKGHDCGVWILDVVATPVNAWYFIMWPLSSRKTAFAASTVKANRQPIACADLGNGLPMISCGEPASLPGTFPITNSSNTVTVGMTSGDVVAGWISIGLSLAIDVAFFGLARYGATKAVRKAIPVKTLTKFIKVIVKKILAEHAEQVLPSSEDANKWFARKTLQAVSGGQTSRITGDPTYKSEVGTPYLGLGIELIKDKKKGWIMKREYHFMGRKWASDGSGARWGKEHGPDGTGSK